MPDTETQNFGLIKPEIGGSDNTWGQKLHDNLDKVDGVLAQLRHRNLVINGNFDLWQRGTVFFGPFGTTYTADRWICTDGTDGVGEVIRTAFSIATPVADYPVHALRYVMGTAAQSGAPVVSQRIEDVRVAHGTLTLSFWAYSSDEVTITPSFWQVFGTNGSDTVLTTAPNITLTTSWQKYVVTLTLPSLTDKTIGDNSYMQLGFLLPTGWTGDFNLARVQLERGNVATPFERRHIVEELALCQRYYQKFITRPRATAGGSGEFYQFTIQVPAMRIAPAFSSTTSLSANVDAIGDRTRLLNSGGADTDFYVRMYSVAAGDMYWYAEHTLDAEV